MTNRILLITQWFDPEPTFKGLLFAKELVARGFEVEVITGFPNYPGGTLYDGYRIKLIQKEIIEGVLISRVPLFPSHDNSKLGRIANYLSFAFSSLLYGLFFAKRPDVIYAYHPPLTVGISASIIKLFRQVHFVLDIQDMWPDTLKATGMISNPGLLGFVSKVCSFVYSFATKIVVLSPGFKSLLIGRGVPDTKIEVIYNWADEKALRNATSVKPKEFDSIQGFKVLYAGNIGKAQGLDVILDAALILKDVPNLHFLVLGRGLELDDLKRRTNDLNIDNVHFLPSVGKDKVGSFLGSADALLIHLNSNPLFEITIPGKTQAYMSAGKPIIMGVRGDAMNLVLKADCGVCFEPEKPDTLAEAIKNLMLLDPADIQRLGENAERFYYENLSVKIGVDSFAKIFKEVIDIEKG
ncbi:glycosyltransferase family 4 protein [Gammaproteobacteria bacterium]|nr:glycosyltransferase family 4 protein [Gammaproteobacteria bacterium]